MQDVASAAGDKPHSSNNGSQGTHTADNLQGLAHLSPTLPVDAGTNANPPKVHACLSIGPVRCD